MSIKTLKGKLIINANLNILSGLHIGSSSDFAPIGAVDATVIRDSVTNQPIIPGSSIKGKLRYLGARMQSGVILKDISDEAMILKRLYGSSSNDEEGIINSRLQFFDLKLKEESVNKLKKANLDLPFTEVKFENTINRLTAIAMPRQLERVPAGSVFNFKLVYNIEDLNELDEDMKFLANSFEILEADYLGGHGTRGYGRVSFDNFSMKILKYTDEDINESTLIEKYFNYNN